MAVPKANCLDCGKLGPIDEFCSCAGGARRAAWATSVYAKPATTEPPEWKGFKFNPLSPEVLEMYRDMSKGCARITGVDFANGGGCTVEAVALSDGSILIDKITVHPAPPEPSPLDRALEDFVARRKAKRDVNRSPSVTEILRDALKKRSADILSRALSTPLPHDPDIHTRLMPWRGKE